MRNVSIGVDPEFFLVKEGEYISAHGMVEGDKRKPLPLDGGAVQVDGTALEFNTDPVTSFKDFDKNIVKVLKQIRGIIPQEYEFLFHPSVEYSKDYFEALPREAVELGCDPDYNAYTGSMNLKPNQKSTIRTGAGHIHIGFNNVKDPYRRRHMDECRTLVIVLDLILNPVLRYFEPDNLRQNLYGKVGDFRPKPYGVEYRTPSNFWITDPKLRKFVFVACQEAVRICKNKDSMLGFYCCIDDMDLHGIEYLASDEHNSAKYYFDTFNSVLSKTYKTAFEKVFERVQIFEGMFNELQ